MSAVASSETNTAASLLGRESRRHLSVTKIWLYVLAVIEILFILAAAYTTSSRGQLGVLVACGIPMVIKLMAGKNIGRFERGDDTALVRAIWLLRRLWITLTVYGAIVLLAGLALVAFRFLR